MPLNRNDLFMILGVIFLYRDELYRAQPLGVTELTDTLTKLSQQVVKAIAEDTKNERQNKSYTEK